MKNSIVELEHYINQIDWKVLEKTIIGFSRLDSTHSKLLSEIQSIESIERKLDITDGFIQFIQTEDYNNVRLDLAQFQPDFDFESTLERINISALVEIIELNQIILCLEFAQSYNKHVVKYVPSLHVDLNKIRKTVSEFRKFVDIEGEISFEKHPQLRPLYLQLKEKETRIRQILEKLIKDPEFSSNLQIQQHDIINDYYVLPIKSDHYQSVFGKIIGRSDSGKTLFVEPKQISQANSERLSLVLEIEKIISRIEQDFIEKLNTHSHETRRSVNNTIFMDEYIARADFAFSKGYLKPELSPIPLIDLKHAEHPLIPNSVPNDINIHQGKGLIISGPNTGGKTASLKLVALYLTLVKRGFYLPARFAKLHPYQKIFFLGQDMQNLEEGLSSFASEIRSYQDLMEQLGETNLILIDEIFNSTASEEASALAYSLLKELNKTGKNTLLVSTHHQTLKQYLHNDEQFISAHVGFDDKTNKPTYKLIYGNPGSSFALEIFSEMSKDSNIFRGILKNAKDYLDTNVVHYEKMLSDLSRKKNELEKQIKKNSQIEQELKNQKQAQDSIFKLKLDKKLEQATSEIDSLRNKAEKVLRDVKAGHITNQNKVIHKFSDIKNELKPEKEDRDNSEQLSLPKPDKLIIGDLYYCTQLGKNIELLEVKKKKVRVLAGKLKAEVPIGSLRKALGGQKTQNSPKVQVNTDFSNLERKLEYDCRGMRLSEFQNLVEQILSDLYGRTMPFANIIHGHGDGILKKWIRNHIKRHSDFKIVLNESGNDGETRIELK